jgi:hypothetical protein
MRRSQKAAFRPVLLIKAKDGIQDDHDKDDDGVLAIARQPGNCGGSHQDQGEDAPELGQ